MAGGHFYLGGGTAVQQATGHQDSPEEMYKYLVAVSRDPDHQKIRAYCEGSVEHFTWLEGLGFQFERSFYPEKAVIQPNTEGLMYTGNEKVWPFFEKAVPAPRGHKVPVPGDTEGAKLVVDLLLKRAKSLGVEIRYETGATQLVVDASGAVTGVLWKRFTETGAAKAKSVIIAAGGFVMNKEMVAAYTPKLAEKPFVLGSTYDDGLGIRLGVSAGGATEHMDQAFITAPAYPPAILLTGIIVNKFGKRFVAEDSYHSRTSGFVMDQPDSVAFLIVDEAHLQRPQVPLVPLIDGWETVPEMEAGLGIPRGNLVATLERYNEFATRGEDPDFHKQPEFLAPQDKGPWGRSTCRWVRRCTPGSPSAGCLRRSTVRCCARTAPSSPVCTRWARAHPISPRTARGMPAAPSLVRDRSSVVAPAPTLRAPRASRRKIPLRQAVSGDLASARADTAIPALRLYRCWLLLDPAQAPAAFAQKLQAMIVIGLDSAAMADADHNCLRQLGTQQLIHR
ncbi:FAD binding domain protein [Mycobacterium xenopi 3993]|nr:FAD binding domain protein [Mycobacterium xenopi 3993]